MIISGRVFLPEMPAIISLRFFLDTISAKIHFQSKLRWIDTRKKLTVRHIIQLILIETKNL